MKEMGETPAAINAAYEDIYFKTEDGLALNGWFLPKDGARLTLLFCHGNAGNISHRLPKLGMLQRLGLNIFIFDYRGYGRSEGSPSEQGLYRDVRAAYKYLISVRGISKENAILYGESLGGAVAIDLATGEIVKAVITEETFSSVSDVAKTIYPFLPKLVFSSRFNSVQKIKGIRAPKLIIHSQDDEIIPFALARKLFDAASQPKEFAIIRGSHNTAYVDSQEEYLAKLKGFLERL